MAELLSNQEATGVADEAAPESLVRPPLARSESLLVHARELLRHRELLLLVAQREIKVRYRETVLGTLWAVLQPLSLMLIFTLFFSTYIGVPSDGSPYPLFSYAALLPWTFLATSVTFAVPSLIANAHIITKIYFPREIIPLAAILAALVDFAVATTLFIALLAFYRVLPSWPAIFALPILAIQIVFTSGLCLLLSAVTALYRDVRFTVPLALQLWMFATPILYPSSVVPESIRALYLGLNPMAVIVEGYRRALIQGQPPDVAQLVAAAAASIALLVLGYACFKRLERQFADVV